MINLLNEKEIIELLKLLGENINDKDKMIKIIEKKQLSLKTKKKKSYDII
mgnify:CR=1 FL=1|tara:strand:- start:5630 stop:5779 length:150 start_codon:yes stop_codon:yes gene_type:complete